MAFAVHLFQARSGFLPAGIIIDLAITISEDRCERESLSDKWRWCAWNVEPAYPAPSPVLMPGRIISLPVLGDVGNWAVNRRVAPGFPMEAEQRE
jgi:hypothetical protein